MTSLSTHQPQKYSKVYPPEHIKAMEAVIAIPSGPKRWRATAAIWVNLNQMQPEGLTAKEAYLAAAQNAKEKRDELHDDFAQLKGTDTARDSGMREQIEPPAGLWGFIKMFDHDAFESKNPDAKRNLRLFAQEFPEFAVARKY